MRLLITGATGFVGRNFLLKALERPEYEQIFVVVRSREKLISQMQGDGFAEIPGRVIPLISSGPDWNGDTFPKVEHLVFCAGLTSAFSKEEYLSANSEAVIQFLRKVPAADKIVVLSSHSAGGPTPSHTPTRIETMEDQPVTWYGESKLEMERRLSRELAYLNYLVLRPPFLLGPRDSATLGLFRLAKSVLRVKPGVGTQAYTYLSVHDLNEAIFSVLASPEDWRKWEQRVYFLGSRMPMTDKELLQAASISLNRDGLTIPIPKSFIKVLAHVVDRLPDLRQKVPILTLDRSRELMPDRWVISSDAFEKRFGWQPKQPLQEIVHQTKDWYQKTKQI